MSHVTTLSTHVSEKSTSLLSWVFKDHAGVAVSSANLTTVTVTLYDKATAAIINSRDGQSILNVNGGTADTSGNGTLKLGPNDNVIVTAARKQEVHVALIQFTYNSGVDAGREELEFTVYNLSKVV